MNNETSIKVYLLCKVAILLALALVICACFLSIAIMDRKYCMESENESEVVTAVSTGIAFDGIAQQFLLHKGV